MSNEINTKAIYDKFVNFIMLDGKKTIAIKIMNNSFEIIKSKGQKDPMGVFTKAIENLLPKIEVRPKRVGGSIYQVPQEVNPKRQVFLASKWLIDAARKKKGTQFSKFLANELIDAANETGDAIKKKLDVYKMAEANKAFARFANKKRK
ncbi:MAG: 30S ribosomal protein S7 [Candidatus Gracilibacteria bacterium]|nr:30S ribosomal protein S7 [Candidatus Gracilibacteria bacterium]MDQ7022806.1 30S ribosomal protein S7 [Candidatus Gracilibacteria bacterium]